MAAWNCHLHSVPVEASLASPATLVAFSLVCEIPSTALVSRSSKLAVSVLLEPSQARDRDQVLSGIGLDERVVGSEVARDVQKA
jgi:hypothetical protein